MRIAEAEVLLQSGHWGGAYYLAGYSVEIGLKACVIKFLLGNDAFPAKDYSKECWTHDLKKLVGLAGLTTSLSTDRANDTRLDGLWIIAATWSEQMRYHFIGESDARSLIDAIAEPTHGFLTWIRKYW